MGELREPVLPVATEPPPEDCDCRDCGRLLLALEYDRLARHAVEVAERRLAAALAALELAARAVDRRHRLGGRESSGPLGGPPFSFPTTPATGAPPPAPAVAGPEVIP